MSIYARLQDGLVSEIISVPTGLTIQEMFHPDFVASCVPCDATVRPGWEYDGSSFSEPQPPVVSARESAMRTLEALDFYLPRCVEDLIVAMSIDEAGLPQIMQDRLAAKRAARAIVSEG